MRDAASTKTVDKGYWLPVDAAKEDPVGWIMVEAITSNIKCILAKRLLIVPARQFLLSVKRFFG